MLRHDLLLLEMSPNGEIASLEEQDTEKLLKCTGWIVDKGKDQTFSYPLINAACNICMLAEGEAAKSMMWNVLQAKETPPAKQVVPIPGNQIWMTS